MTMKRVQFRHKDDEILEIWGNDGAPVGPPSYCGVWWHSPPSLTTVCHCFAGGRRHKVSWRVGTDWAHQQHWTTWALCVTVAFKSSLSSSCLRQPFDLCSCTNTFPLMLSLLPDCTRQLSIKLNLTFVDFCFINYFLINLFVCIFTILWCHSTLLSLWWSHV